MAETQQGRNPVRILYLEDDAEDVRLTLQELSRGGLEAAVQVVSTISLKAFHSSAVKVKVSVMANKPTVTSALPFMLVAQVS